MKPVPYSTLVLGLRRSETHDAAWPYNACSHGALDAAAGAADCGPVAPQRAYGVGGAAATRH
eukprot:14189601-Alexandrium_andersonii.AAC.1